MSIQAMAWVLENSESELGDRLVLLSLASHADASWCCFPSIGMIAREARISERQVYRCLANLERLGELERVPGGGRGRRNTYRIGYYKGCQDDRVNPNLTLTNCQETLTSDALNPDTVGTHNRKEPSWNPHAGAREAFPERQTWTPEGALEALSEEQRQANLQRLRDLRGKAEDN